MGVRVGSQPEFKARLGYITRQDLGYKSKHRQDMMAHTRNYNSWEAKTEESRF